MLNNLEIRTPPQKEFQLNAHVGLIVRTKATPDEGK
jgi:hypothetical protein